MLSGSKLAYVEKTKYLGVVLKSGRSFKCALDHVKTKLYRSVNAILLELRFVSSFSRSFSWAAVFSCAVHC